MYLLISLCYFTAKGQIAGTQHYRNRLNRSRYDIKQEHIKNSLYRFLDTCYVVVLVDTTYLHIGILRMLRIHHDRSYVVVSIDTTMFPKTKYLLLHRKFGFDFKPIGLHGHSLGTLQMRYALVLSII